MMMFGAFLDRTGVLGPICPLCLGRQFTISLVLTIIELLRARETGFMFPKRTLYFEISKIGTDDFEKNILGNNGRLKI